MDEQDKNVVSNLLLELQREDLSPLSLSELTQRIAILENEIARIRDVIGNKKGSHADAEALFKK